jgi:5-methylcytosine-specific restriction endonuclease McrA
LKAKLYREANKEKISVYMKEYKKKYRKNNKDKINAKSAERKARKLKARPSWLTKEDLKVIGNFYKEAQELTLLTGEQYHVDHIVPLQGENVCGLHVPWNLQVITAKENLSKHNKLLD